jgi:hypothetical protein
MENNNNEMRSIHDHVPSQAPAEPVIESVAEPVVEAVVEAPVVEAVVETSAEAVVEAPAVEEPVQALGFTQTGAIGSIAADGPKRKIKPESELGNKVAIYSTKNVNWSGVGSVSRGYNIVTQAQADKWLTRSHVRLATPEEVKKVLG